MQYCCMLTLVCHGGRKRMHKSRVVGNTLVEDRFLYRKQRKVDLYLETVVGNGNRKKHFFRDLKYVPICLWWLGLHILGLQLLNTGCTCNDREYNGQRQWFTNNKGHVSNNECFPPSARLLKWSSTKSERCMIFLWKCMHSGMASLSKEL